MVKRKWYVVLVGKNPGIYSSWLDAGMQVRDFPGNLHQSFHTQEDAEHYFYKYYPQLQRSGNDLDDLNAQKSGLRSPANNARSLAVADASRPEGSAQRVSRHHTYPSYTNERKPHADRPHSIEDMFENVSDIKYIIPANMKASSPTKAGMSLTSPTPFVRSVSELSSPTTELTYIIPSDGGRQIRGRDKRRAAMLEGDEEFVPQEAFDSMRVGPSTSTTKDVPTRVSSGAIRVSKIASAPAAIFSSPGIQVTRWRSSADSIVSVSPATSNVKESQPYNLRSPRLDESISPKRREEDISPTSSDSGESYPSGRESPAFGSSVSRRKDIAYSVPTTPRRVAMTPAEQSMKLSQPSPTRTPRNQAGNGPTGPGTPNSRFVPESISSWQTVRSEASEALPSNQSPTRYRKRESSQTCHCAICPHGSLVTEGSSPEACGCRICKHGQLKVADVQHRVDDLLPAAAASLSLSQSSDLAAAVYDAACDPRSPVAGSSGLPFGLSRTAVFGRPSPILDVKREPDGGILLG